MEAEVYQLGERTRDKSILCLSGWGRQRVCFTFSEATIWQQRIRAGEDLDAVG